MRGPFRWFFSQPFDRKDFGERSFPEHRELYEDIAKRDPDQSRKKTIELLDRVEMDIRDVAVPVE